VSPIIIPCSLYLPPSISRMEQLSEKDDFDRAIELIYGSDCNVYEKLFGSLQNAKQILPYLLNDPASKCYKKHYHFFRKKEKIIAIAALYDIEDFSWDINTDLMKKAFGNAGIELPESFDKAVTLLKNTFNNYHGKSFCYLDDVCVLEGERRRRIGSSMIMYLIKLAESQGKAVRLSVQSNNLIARQMYANLGFVATTKEVSEISNALEYIQMVRI
ncbi:MAG: GNAT family N-acetyltransferase, partial [Deltaproteobacteria bacterium]|nr:GNAT family N-acetyltransferase [Deltaproteobacteria bacterium]